MDRQLRVWLDLMSYGESSSASEQIWWWSYPAAARPSGFGGSRFSASSRPSRSSDLQSPVGERAMTVLHRSSSPVYQRWPVCVSYFTHSIKINNINKAIHGECLDIFEVCSRPSGTSDRVPLQTSTDVGKPAYGVASVTPNSGSNPRSRPASPCLRGTYSDCSVAGAGTMRQFNDDIAA